MSDLLILTPPFSPHDATPPLGPAVLVAHARAAGHDAHALDLNIRYLRLFDGGSRQRLRVVGDHAKDRVRVEAAREHFTRSLHLAPAAVAVVPCGADPVLSLAHDFATLDRAVDAMLLDGFWPSFLNSHLAGLPEPRVLGVSIMGPAQVLPALVVAKFAKLIWPNVLVVAGGSHVTLLADEIASDVRYCHGVIDAFLPGHSEHTLVALVAAVKSGCGYDLPGVLRAGHAYTPAADLAPAAWLPPTFDASELELYEPVRCSLPVQLSRGCSYGKCRFCTYPAVETLTRGGTAHIASSLLETAVRVGIQKVSIKDSLFDRKAMQAFGLLVGAVAPGLTWSCTTKVNRGMRAEELRQLHAHGLRTVELGVETIHANLQLTIDKVQPLDEIDGVIAAYLDAGISVVINLLYGLPGETREQADAQWRWFCDWKVRGGGLVHGSHNLMEVNRKSILALSPTRHGVKLGHVGPWGFGYVWNAPVWRREFAAVLAEATGEKVAA